MGKTMGQSVQSGFSSYVILQFGEPWKEGQQYGVLGYGLDEYGNYVFIPVSDVESFVKAYLSGFYNNSPAYTYLIVVVGITNQGLYMEQAHGEAWGDLITNVVDWIETPPSYSGKVGVAGGIDNELSWNGADDSLDWRYGYILTTSRFYIYYGDCNSCPFEDEPDWTPEDYG